MIFAAGFPFDFFIALFVFIGALCWQCRVVWFAARRTRHTVPRWFAIRQYLCQHRRRGWMIAVLCQIPLLCYGAYIAQRIYIEHAKNPTLNASFSYGEIVFPAGTQLTTWEPNDLSQIRAAVLPQAMMIFGLSVKRLDFENYWVNLTLSKPQQINGFWCSDQEQIGVRWEDRHSNAINLPSRWYFDECELVAHQILYGIDWPERSQIGSWGGSEAQFLTSHKFTHYGPSEPIKLRGGLLSEFRLEINRQGGILSCEGRVAQPFQVAERQFAAGEDFEFEDSCPILSVQTKTGA